MAIVPGIGVISSIGYVGTNLETNFRRGVNHDAWCTAAPPRDNIGYDAQALRNEVINFNGNGNVGVIVTVGGLVSAIAAQKYATKPFLSLIGGTNPDFPGTITENFYGGVSLETFAHNNDRFSHLTGPPHNFTPSQICFLSNPKSAMATSETALWPTPPRGRIFTATSDAEIAQAFIAFGNDKTLRAMIMSADPFFQDHKDALIAAANSSGKHVCYPLQIYANNGRPHQPNGGHHTKHGPKLATEYFNLGQKAAFVITNDRPSTLDTAPTEVHDG